MNEPLADGLWQRKAAFISLRSGGESSIFNRKSSTAGAANGCGLSCSSFDLSRQNPLSKFLSASHLLKKVA
jgi:hypothetical protein